MTHSLLVTGSTGHQGGALIDSLLAQDADFQILAVTRNPESSSAKKLASRSSRITLVQGNLDDVEALFEAAAQKATELPIWGVYSVQVPNFTKDGPAIEIRQGNAMIDASLSRGVRHFVYSSVDRGGARSSDNPTNVPHFSTKHAIEKHLFEAASGKPMTWTALRPTGFMENFGSTGFSTKLFFTCWKLAARSRPTQLVSTEDIGWFAAKAFADPEWSAGKCISLAGDETTWENMVAAYREKKGTEAPMTWGIVARIILWISPGLKTMFEFFDKEGFGADLLELKKIHPGLMDVATWLERTTGKEQ